MKAPELPQDYSEEQELNQVTHSLRCKSIIKSTRQQPNSSVVDKRMNLERRKDSLGHTYAEERHEVTVGGFDQQRLASRHDSSMQKQTLCLLE